MHHSSPHHHHLRRLQPLVAVAVLGAAIAMAAPVAGAATQAPWTTAVSLPATVQTELYDRGGEGVAFHDVEAANLGGALRTTEGVDVGATSDTGGGYVVGHIRSGEWLEYTVNVATAGRYDIGLRYASANAGGKVSVRLGSTNLTGAVTLATTGSWQTWTTVWVSGVTLTAGNGQILRLSIDSSADGRDMADINWIDVRASGSTTPTTTTTTTSTTTTSTTSTTAATTTTTTVEPTTTTAGGTTTTTTVEPTTTTTGGTTTTTATTVAPTTTTTVALKAVTWPTSFRSAPAAPEERYEVASAVIGTKIYVFGGFHDAGRLAVHSYASYDTVTGAWRTLGDLPDGMAETHLGLATDGHDIYFAGGFGGDIQPVEPEQWVSDEVWRYTPSTDKWTLLTHLPTPRGAGGLALVGRTLHYLGGNPTDRVTDLPDHLTFDLDTKVWGSAKPLPNPKDHFSTIVVGGKIYVLGGQHGHHILHEQQSDGHVYDPATNTWKALPAMPVAKSHAETSTFVSNGRIVVAGGQVDWFSPTAKVAAYTIATNSWSTLTSIPSARQGVIIQRVGNTVVIALGAIRSDDPQSTVWLGSL